MEEYEVTSIPSSIWTKIPNTNLEVLQMTGHVCNVKYDKITGLLTFSDKANWRIKVAPNG